MIAPRFEDAALGVLDEVLDADALAARTEDNTVAPVGSIAVDVSEFEETWGCECLWDWGCLQPADIAEVIEAVEEAADAVVDGSVDPDKVDVEETEVVLVGNTPMTPAVVNESVSSSPSSGQTPVVHGSVGQHPRKLPAEQTYHCAVPVQVLRSRGTRGPSDLKDSVSNTILKYQVSFTESETTQSDRKTQHLC
ncbi:hypothetical protein PEX1_061050 [Penicillium expansum]|uniref:Uncharacterized protein n=1 Tax=Penicillium expansum TaxID=27334 RepID=A0A0A2L704_PENEN|nr:hypothetical protein PEX2_085940 [Penicillium expansum]KGO37211.1 hypothetical protein PEXP_002360 [Penicillium expansum]KGO61519.1 hypothetical protein PEX2_085940 [Penicillium expansum]KGO72410.1 hypothetical protein PEX1_061050 [Penicillium expansum]